MRTALLTVALAALVACSGRSVDRYVRSGDRYMGARKYAEAIIQYRNAIRLAPDAAALQRKLGDAYTAIHDFVGAAIAYETAWKLAPPDTATAIKAGDAHLAFGDINGAAALARQLLQIGESNVDAHLLLARALVAAGDFAAAEKELRRAVALAPGNPSVYEVLADLQRRAGNRPAAEASLIKAAMLSPKSPRPRVALASLYLDAGRLDEGEQQLRTAIDIAPTDPDANRAYASLLVATDRCEDAEPYWQKLSNASSDASGTLSLADYYVYTARPDDALRVLTPLTAERDDGGAARLRVAAIYYDRGDGATAERLSDQVLAHEPANATALLLKARIARDRGDRKNALDYAQRAVNAAPDAPAALDLLNTLQAPPTGGR